MSIEETIRYAKEHISKFIYICGIPHHLEREKRDWIQTAARSYANALQRKGMLIQEPCILCGNPKTIKHHPNYHEFDKVVWLCIPCHAKVHGELTRIRNKVIADRLWAKLNSNRG